MELLRRPQSRRGLCLRLLRRFGSLLSGLPGLGRPLLGPVGVFGLLWFRLTGALPFRLLRLSLYFALRLWLVAFGLTGLRLIVFGYGVFLGSVLCL